MFFDVILSIQFELGLANRFKAFGHFSHMSFKQPHGHGRWILEQVTGPGEWIGIEWEGGAPYRGTARSVNDTHGCPTLIGFAIGIEPFEVTQFF